MGNKAEVLKKELDGELLKANPELKNDPAKLKGFGASPKVPEEFKDDHWSVSWNPEIDLGDQGPSYHQSTSTSTHHQGSLSVNSLWQSKSEKYNSEKFL